MTFGIALQSKYHYSVDSLILIGTLERFLPPMLCNPENCLPIYWHIYWYFENHICGFFDFLISKIVSINWFYQNLSETRRLHCSISGLYQQEHNIMRFLSVRLLMHPRNASSQFLLELISHWWMIYCICIAVKYL